MRTRSTEACQPGQGFGGRSPDKQAVRTAQGQSGEWVFLDVNVDNGFSPAEYGQHHLIRQRGRSGRADNDQQVSLIGPGHGTVKSKIILVVILVEPQYVRPQPGTAMFTMQKPDLIVVEQVIGPLSF